MPRQFARRSLDALAVNLLRNQTPGYPAQSDRLVLSQPNYTGQGLLDFPTAGPTIAGQAVPTHEQKLNEILGLVGYPIGLTIDADWRPLHPWWRQMLARPDIGVAVGRGFFYQWGPNYTADAAVIAKGSDGNEKLLLIQRCDTGDWALPGGFIDENERSRTAALRELQEESGVRLSHETPSELVYKGPVLDTRTTLNAWTETSLWKFVIQTDELPAAAGGDDAINAQWFDIQDLPEALHGSHPVLIAQILDSMLRV
jgi:ADP-ribose pyrophosphatase YjhB (NUDIX family)